MKHFTGSSQSVEVRFLPGSCLKEKVSHEGNFWKPTGSHMDYFHKAPFHGCSCVKKNGVDGKPVLACWSRV